MQFATSANTNPVSPGKFKKTVSQESPQSVREFTKQIEVRDQTECKETFKAIKNAQTTEEKNAILDQALEYFMQKAAAEEKEYFGKLEQVGGREAVEKNCHHAGSKWRADKGHARTRGKC